MYLCLCTSTGSRETEEIAPPEEVTVVGTYCHFLTSAHVQWDPPTSYHSYRYFYLCLKAEVAEPEIKTEFPSDSSIFLG